jgi:hypothetical protein
VSFERLFNENISQPVGGLNAKFDWKKTYLDAKATNESCICKKYMIPIDSQNTTTVY